MLLELQKYFWKSPFCKRRNDIAAEEDLFFATMSTFVDPCNVLKVFLEVITTFTVQRVKIWIKKESKKNSFHDNSLSA